MLAVCEPEPLTVAATIEKSFTMSFEFWALVAGADRNTAVAMHMPPYEIQGAPLRPSCLAKTPHRAFPFNIIILQNDSHANFDTFTQRELRIS
jgi:hypothetical protein